MKKIEHPKAAPSPWEEVGEGLRAFGRYWNHLESKGLTGDTHSSEEEEALIANIEGMADIAKISSLMKDTLPLRGYVPDIQEAIAWAKEVAPGYFDGSLIRYTQEVIRREPDFQLDEPDGTNSETDAVLRMLTRLDDEDKAPEIRYPPDPCTGQGLIMQPGRTDRISTA